MSVIAGLPAPLPRGGIVTVTGHGKTEWAVRLLAQNRQQPAAWLERRLTVYPPALKQRAVDLQRLLFVEAGEEAPWALQQLLRSQLFRVVVTSGAHHDERGLRRLQMLTEEARAVLVLLEKQTSPAWAVGLKLAVVRRRVAGGDELHLEILKSRF